MPNNKAGDKPRTVESLYRMIHEKTLNTGAALKQSNTSTFPASCSVMSVTDTEPTPSIGKIKIGCLNVGGLSTKAQTMERIMERLDLDMLFVSETWCSPGCTKRLSSWIAYSSEHQKRSIQGHAPYGQCIFLNPKTTGHEDLVIISEDQSEDQCFVTVRLRGLIFVCCYFAPSRTSEWYTEKLDDTCRFALEPHPVIMMGDLNARSLLFGDQAGNTYGTALVEEMESFELTRTAPIRGRFTFVSGTKRSIVDHVLSNPAASSLIDSLEVHENLYTGGSEHRVLTFSVQCQSEPVPVPVRHRPWNRLRLNDPVVIEELQAHCNGTIEAMLMEIVGNVNGKVDDPSTTVDAIDLMVRDWIEDGLRACVGKAPAAKPGWASQFMTRELIASESIVEHHFSMWSEQKDNPAVSQRLWETFNAHRNAHLTLASVRKREMFESFCTKISNMNNSETARMVSSMKRNKSRAGGNTLKTDPAALQEYKAHYERQFTNVNAIPDGPARTWNTVEKDSFKFGALFTVDHIRTKIKELPKGKAAGNSGIIAEALRALSDLASEPLKLLFDFICKSGMIPSGWKVARIQPVPKKGDLTKISNHRPISLTEVIRKLFESILIDPLVGLLEPLSVEQGGFRRKRGTLDQIAALQEWICQAKSVKLGRYMAFLDIKAAYDQVDRTILWEKCKSKSVPSNMINVLKALFDHNEAFLAINGHSTERFKINCGVLQGSLLSPLLYSVFIDDIVDDINQLKLKDAMSLGGRPYRILLYADDIVLMANSRLALQRMLDTCERHAALNRYRFNVPKCAVLSNVEHDPVRLHDQEMPKTEEFVYLGCTFREDGIDWDAHAKRLSTKATAAAASLAGAGLSARNVGLSTALTLYGTFVRPIIEYCLALAPQSKTKLATKTHRRCLQWLSSSGQNACVDTIGLFGNLEPLKARQERLAFGFWKRVSSLSTDIRHFSVVDAYKAFRTKKAKDSCFTNCASHELVTRFERARNRRAFNGGQDIEEVCWKLRKEELLKEISLEYRSAYIFGALEDDTERKAWKRSFQSLSPKEQQSIFLWVLNRAVGPWKLCRGCNLPGGSKSHVEACILGLQGGRTGPSQMEDRLFDNMRDPAVLMAVAADIRLCIGNGPTN